MLLTVLQTDLAAVKKTHQIEKTYQQLIENTILKVQKDLAEAKRYLHKSNVKIERGKPENNFTDYMMRYKGREDPRHYFNAKIRHTVEDLLDYYLVGHQEEE